MPIKAVCVSNEETIKVFFDQDSPDSPVKVSGEVTGLAKGLHGFHIHEFGDNTNGKFHRQSIRGCLFACH